MIICDQERWHINVYANKQRKEQQEYDDDHQGKSDKHFTSQTRECKLGQTVLTLQTSTVVFTSSTAAGAGFTKVVVETSEEWARICGGDDILRLDKRHAA
jgi:hypothetical protein